MQLAVKTTAPPPIGRLVVLAPNVQPEGAAGGVFVQLTLTLAVLPAPMLFLGVTVYVRTTAAFSTAEQLCAVVPWQFPPVQVHAFGEPAAQIAVSVIAVPVCPVVGPEIVHPDGEFDTMQFSVWFGADPVSEKLSQLLSFKVTEPAWTGEATKVNSIAAQPSAAPDRAINERNMNSP